MAICIQSVEGYGVEYEPAPTNVRSKRGEGGVSDGYRQMPARRTTAD